MNFLSSIFEFLNLDALGSFKLIVLGYFGLLWLSIIIWVTRDALARSSNLFFQAISILLNILIPILGVVIYLIIRPEKTQMERYYEKLESSVLEGEERQLESKLTCHRCLNEVHENYAFCPKCAYQLKKICPGCKKSFSDEWTLCPFCGKEYKSKQLASKINKKPLLPKAKEEKSEAEFKLLTD